MTAWSPIGCNGKMFAVSAVLGVIFGFQVEKLDKYNNLLFNFFYRIDFFGLNQLSDMTIYMIDSFNRFGTLKLLLH